MLPGTFFVTAATSGAEGEDRTFLLAPDAGAVAWTIVVWAFAVVAVSCAVVLVRKRRWGWLLVGFVTGGLGWFAAFVVDPAPGSPWALRSERRRAAGMASPHGPT
jgi:hypothetical protein